MRRSDVSARHELGRVNERVGIRPDRGDVDGNGIALTAFIDRDFP